MDIESFKIFIELLSNSAFPIFACVALFYILTKQQKELTKQIENNTKVLSELTTIIKMINKNEKRY